MNNGIKHVRYYVDNSISTYVYSTLSEAISSVKHQLMCKNSFVFGIYDSSARIYKDEVYCYDSIEDQVYHYHIDNLSYPTMKYKKEEYIKLMKRLTRRLRPILLRYGK